MDTMSSESRSRVMRSIRSEWTKPELEAIGWLRENGCRYSVHVRAGGRPDFLVYWRESKRSPGRAVPFRRPIALFIDGCFWHWHLSHQKLPRSNIRYWWPKLIKNKIRDFRKRRAARRERWHPVRVWACQLSRERLDEVIRDGRYTKAEER